MKASLRILLTLLLLLSFVGLRKATLQRTKIGVAVPFAIWEIEPLEVSNPVTQIVLANITRSLVKKDVGGDWINDIAEKVVSKKNGKVWEIRISSETSFPDGTPLQATSIRDSFLYLKERAKLKSNLPEISLQQGLINIKNIAVSREELEFANTVRAEFLKFTLHEADEDFQRILALPVFNAEVLKQFSDDVFVGTNISSIGAYQVIENKPGEGVLLEGVDNYHQPGFPLSKSLDIRSYPEATAALSALRVGSVDIIFLPTAELIKNARKDPTLSVIATPFGKGPWTLSSTSWSGSEEEGDEFVPEFIISRKSLKLDHKALAHFDLSGAYLP